MLIEFSEIEPTRVKGDRFHLHLRRIGQGSPLVLLHGYPQTSYTWEKIIGGLQAHFECFLFDLPGYGDSDALDPVEGEDTYSKTAMAREVLSAMKALGFPRFCVLGHDRGARVAYRMALNHPEAVSKLGLIEIIPTVELWNQFNADRSVAAYHWSFLAQPYPLPETLILSNPEFYADWTLAGWSRDGGAVNASSAALESYRNQFRDPARVRAFCEDYRAGYGRDQQDDRLSLETGDKIACPVFVLHSGKGFASGKTGSVLDVWRRWASDVEGHEVVAGHFIQEELPDETLAAFVPFFRD